MASRPRDDDFADVVCRRLLGLMDADDASRPQWEIGPRTKSRTSTVVSRQCFALELRTVSVAARAVAEPLRISLIEWEYDDSGYAIRVEDAEGLVVSRGGMKGAMPGARLFRAVAEQVTERAVTQRRQAVIDALDSL